ncbi:hypothetical protein ACSBR2_034700 [Camellia fascicularis]
MVNAPCYTIIFPVGMVLIACRCHSPPNLNPSSIQAIPNLNCDDFAGQRLGPPNPDDLRHVDSVSMEEIGSVWVTIVRNEENRNFYIDDLERAVDDGVNTYKAMCRDSRIVPRVAATEIELARRLKEFSLKETRARQVLVSGPLADMVGTCYKAAKNGMPNFLAVNFYMRSDGGGVFDALDRMNGQTLCGCGSITACQDWLGRATNWAKFSATAGLGVIHRGHLQQGRSLMAPYLPQSGAGGGGSP